MIDYFNISFIIKDNKPKFSIKLKDSFVNQKPYPIKKVKNGKKIPLSSSSLDYFKYYFDDDDIAEKLYNFRKKFFNISEFLKFINLNNKDKALVDEYFRHIKEKEVLNHKSAISKESYRDKLKTASLKNREAVKEKYKKLFENEEERKKLVDNLHSDSAKKKRINSFKLTINDAKFKEAFLKKINSDEVRAKKSLSHKNRWKKLSNDQKAKQLSSLKYKKKYTLSNNRMNLNEFKIAKALNEIEVPWDYEPQIEINGEIFYPDFLLKNKIIIECYGKYWHADPRYFNKDHIFYKKHRASEIWEEDQKRVSTLESGGYNVFIFWESDIISNYESVKIELRRITNELCI